MVTHRRHKFRALVVGQIDAEVYSVFIGTGLELAFQEKVTALKSCGHGPVVRTVAYGARGPRGSIPALH